MAYEDEVLADTPVAYWRLGTGATDVNDSSGNGHTLTKTGSPVESTSLLPSTINTSREIPGDNSARYDALDDDAFDFLNTAPFSIEAWINVHTWDTSFRRCIGHEDATNSWAMGAQSTSGLWFLRTAGGAVNNMTVVNGISLATTYYIVGTYDGTHQRFYINAVLRDGPDAISTNMGAVANTVRTGPFTGSSQMDGVIDEIAVYPVALALDRIQAHYAAGLAAARPADAVPFPMLGRGAGW